MRRALTGVVVLGFLAAGAAAGNAQDETTYEPAVEVLARITVAEDASMDDYERSDWGTSWTDAAGSGCDTRNDVLARDLDPDTLSVREDCAVEYGETTDPYSGEWMEHILGESQVDIEHVVAVGQAHRNGGHDWTEEQRQEFYQDKENLLAVSASENRSKGSRDVTEYMPPNQGIYCEFVGTKIYIKDKYELSMTPAEHQFIENVLADPECADTPAAPAVAMTDAGPEEAAAAEAAPIERETEEPAEEQETESPEASPDAAEEQPQSESEDGDDDEVPRAVGLVLLGAIVAGAIWWRKRSRARNPQRRRS